MVAVTPLDTWWVRADDAAGSLTHLAEKAQKLRLTATLCGATITPVERFKSAQSPRNPCRRCEQVANERALIETIE